LTPHDATRSLTPRPDSGAGAPADVIEITTEMIKAGVKEFYDCRGLEIDTAESAVYAIFKAMVEASPALRSFRLVDLSE
jgi:hypothetical protein